MQKHLTVKEVAEILRHHRKTIIRMIHKGRISAFKVGCGRRSQFLISQDEIERLAMIGYEENMKQIREGLSKGEHL